MRIPQWTHPLLGFLVAAATVHAGDAPPPPGPSTAPRPPAVGLAPGGAFASKRHISRPGSSSDAGSREASVLTERPKGSGDSVWSKHWDLSDPTQRARLSEYLRAKQSAEKAKAKDWARRRGLPTKIPGGEIQRIERGEPVYYGTTAIPSTGSH
jgi:hypothetical protein